MLNKCECLTVVSVIIASDKTIVVAREKTHTPVRETGVVSKIQIQTNNAFSKVDFIRFEEVLLSEYRSVLVNLALVIFIMNFQRKITLLSAERLSGPECFTEQDV